MQKQQVDQQSNMQQPQVDMQQQQLNGGGAPGEAEAQQPAEEGTSVLPPDAQQQMPQPEGEAPQQEAEAPQQEAEASPQEEGGGDDVSQEEIQEFINSLPPDALTGKSTEEDEESE